MKPLVHDQPVNEKGEQFEFDCCPYPTVCWKGTIGDSPADCLNCGYEWTRYLNRQ